METKNHVPESLQELVLSLVKLKESPQMVEVFTNLRDNLQSIDPSRVSGIMVGVLHHPTEQRPCGDCGEVHDEPVFSGGGGGDKTVLRSMLMVLSEQLELH